jgi:hypothetical protein
MELGHQTQIKILWKEKLMNILVEQFHKRVVILFVFKNVAVDVQGQMEVVDALLEQVQMGSVDVGKKVGHPVCLDVLDARHMDKAVTTVATQFVMCL